MTIISELRESLPDTPFAYGLFTFCMNFGMTIWFIYLICVNKKTKGAVKTDKYLKKLKPSMIRFMRKKYSGAEVMKRWKKTERLYCKWLREEGDLGGRENIMSSNIYMCFAFCAFYESVDRNFTEKDFYILYNEVMADKLSMLGYIDMNKLENNRLILKFVYMYLNRYKKICDKKRGREWGNTWKVRVNSRNRKKGIAFSLDSCPLNEFARKYGYTDILPFLCRSDHLMAKAFHAKLIRHKTLSNGDDTCEYWYVGDKSPEASADKKSK
ncbi:MAG: L-2-amino-thiazoline-4-carboxylic acid hydrolase [Ruminococcus sp.]|nr:L-2-amino-thiazoline-4-carboxylic acid hydrolase [Ruminococcus sp.]